MQLAFHHTHRATLAASFFQCSQDMVGGLLLQQVPSWEDNAEVRAASPESGVAKSLNSFSIGVRYTVGR